MNNYFNFNQNVSFEYFRDGCLWYSTLKGFEFPVPINALGNSSVCKRIEKAERFKYWILKELKKKDIDKK